MNRPGAGGRRRDILDEAARLFSEKGYWGTSMRDLAEASGMRPATLYSHISGKESLLFEILDEVVQKFTAGAAGIVAGPEPPDEKLRSFCRFHMRVVADHLEAATVHFHEYRYLPPEQLRELIGRRDAYEAGVRSIVEEGIRLGVFEAVDVPVAAVCVLSLLNYAYQWYSPEGRLSPEALGDLFAGLLLDGLLAGRPAAAGPAAAGEPPGSPGRRGRPDRG